MKGDTFQDRHEVFVLTRAEQLRALGATATHDVFLGLLKIGEGSIAEIAMAIGKTPHSLYHHMEKLQSVGLVLPAGKRRSGARIEQLYRPVAHLLQTDPTNNDPDYLAAIAENARADFRRAGKAITYALEHGLANREPEDINSLALQFTVPLTEKQRRQLVAQLHQVVDDFTANLDAEPEAPAHIVTLGLSPIKPT